MFVVNEKHYRSVIYPTDILSQYLSRYNNRPAPSYKQV